MANSAWGVPIPEDKDYDQDSGSEYGSYESDSYSEDADDEYGELQMSSWGNQSTPTPQQTASFDVPITDWHKLMDPSVQIKAGEVGSGGLHRQGKNYKPVDEQAILNQRLKGTPVPSGSKSKKKGSKKKSGNGDPSVSSVPKKNKKKSTTLRPPSSSAVRSRLPLSNSVWGGSELASTPFWETSGSGASKYATNRTAATTSTQRQQQHPPSHTSKQHDSQRKSLPPHSNHRESKYQPSSAKVNQPTPVRSASKSFLGSASSKYANSSTTTSTSLSEKHKALPLLPSKEAILKLNIEITPGISAVLDIYETNDYKKLVRDFGEKHHLKISEEAENAFAEKISVLIKNVNRSVLNNDLD
ncbi:hypothetical protein BJ944DRAFT_260729 [Cunninghamella echinulata]|nr:hypothetical protein BJ944DRAFT_260729 [Cunninghamella echinulata]